MKTFEIGQKVRLVDRRAYIGVITEVSTWGEVLDNPVDSNGIACCVRFEGKKYASWRNDTSLEAV